MIWITNLMFFLQQGIPGGAGTAEKAAPATTGGAEAATDAVAGQCGALSPLWMVVFFIAMMYFLLIRPQKKQQQKHQEMLNALRKGDHVVTTGGILGTVRELAGNVLVIEVADKVAIRVKKEHVAGLQTEPGKEVKKN